MRVLVTGIGSFQKEGGCLKEGVLKKTGDHGAQFEDNKTPAEDKRVINRLGGQIASTLRDAWASN